MHVRKETVTTTKKKKSMEDMVGHKNKMEKLFTTSLWLPI